MGNIFSSSSKTYSSSSCLSDSLSDSSKSSSSTSTSNSSSSCSSDSLSNSSKNSSTNNISNSSSKDGSKDGSKISPKVSSSRWFRKIKTNLKSVEICKSLEEEELDELVFNLGNETRFLNQYLEFHYDNDHLNKITKDLQKLDNLQRNNFIPSEEDGRNLINGLLKRRRESDKFNVYLFISKLSNNRSDSSFLRLLAKDVFKNKYGMFHVGLEIDGIVLEWGTGDAGPHLIYPWINTKRMYEKIAHIRINYDSNLSDDLNHSTNSFLQVWKQYLHNFISVISDIMRGLLSFVMTIGVIPSNKLQVVAQKCVYWNRILSLRSTKS
jgi:hypothetical protein